MLENNPKKIISIIVPVYNEEKNISVFYKEAREIVKDLPYAFEYIFVNDGSTDNSSEEIEKLKSGNIHVKHVEFSRNFGKEVATSAGLHFAVGNAAIVIDADLQHPVVFLPQFIEQWNKGAEIVVGVRNASKSDSFLKRIGSTFFYKIMQAISDTKIIPGTTDFRLLDRVVIDEFNRLTERTRLTRGLIDWLGFRKEYIYFDAEERRHGHAHYSIIKLFRLAISSFVSHSLMPLRLAGYLGGLIFVLSGILGVIMFLDKFVTNWGLAFSGPAILADIILFLVGIILICIGILAVYIGNIHQEVQNRPLYVVRRNKM